MSKNIVAQYFDECFIDYEANWSRDHLHFGFWHENTKDNEESLINTVKEALNYLELNDKDNLLDMGAGTGGACRLAATLIGCKVTGITNSRVLYENALKLTINYPFSGLASYILGDYLKSGLSDGSFSRILAIESACQADDKNFLIEEMYRILAPGGRVVIFDYFLPENLTEESYSLLYKEWLKSWGIPHIATVDFYEKEMKECGFSQITYYDKSDEVKKSTGFLAERINKFLPRIVAQCARGEISKMRLNNLTASVKLNDFLNQGLWQYGIIVADKPI